jgi:phosphoribosylformylglycinamidine synthase
MHGELEAEIEAEILVLGGGAPQYEREYRRPGYLEKVGQFDINKIPEPENLRSVARSIGMLHNIASKRYVYTQYDSMVGTGNTQTNAPSDAAVVLAKPSGKALAVTTDCNSRYVFADPYRGAMISVSEAARNIVCSGGEPLGVTNCLNFGNPYDPEVYYQFAHAIKGMGDACRKFNTPVTGGNVSFYNQNPDGAVYPTPTIGMVGLLESPADKMTMYFKQTGDIILMVGESRNDIASSEYLHKIHGVEFSPAPYFDLDEEYNMQQAVSALIKSKLIKSAHDISEGGLFTALCEKGFFTELGFTITTRFESLQEKGIRPDAYLFGEAQGRVLISVNPEQLVAVEEALTSFGQPYEMIGEVTDGAVWVAGEQWGFIGGWKDRYDTAIENILKGHEEDHALMGL